METNNIIIWLIWERVVKSVRATSERKCLIIIDNTECLLRANLMLSKSSHFLFIATF